MQNVETQNAGTTVDNRIKKEATFNTIEVSRVYKNTYQKEGTLTAELKQTVSTVSHYPTKSVANNLQDNPFSTEEFAFEEKEFTNLETRVAWINVPEGMAEDKVKERIASLADARIMKILSNKPILTTDQEYAIANAITTKDVIAASQVVRYPANHTDPTLAGKIIPDTNGKIQYRANYFRNKTVADQDLRTPAPADFWASAELLAEMTGYVHAEQSDLIPGTASDEKI